MIDHDARRFMTRVFVLLLMFNATELRGQLPSGARNLGLGNAAVAVKGIHSIGNNAAGIASLEKPVVSVVYGERFFNVNTRSFTGKFAVPTSFATFGVYGNHLTFKNHYLETSAGLTIGKSISSNFAFGLSANYHLINIPDEMEISYLSAEVGVQYFINQAATLGLSMENLQRFWNEDDTLFDQPTAVSVGAAYQFSHQVLLATEFSHVLKNRTDFSVGIEYLPMGWSALRGGLSVNPFMQYVGAGILMDKFRVDLATSYHPQLGYSPQVSIDYRF